MRMMALTHLMITCSLLLIRIKIGKLFFNLFVFRTLKAKSSFWCDPKSDISSSNGLFHWENIISGEVCRETDGPAWQLHWTTPQGKKGWKDTWVGIF